MIRNECCVYFERKRGFECETEESFQKKERGLINHAKDTPAPGKLHGQFKLDPKFKSTVFKEQ